MAKGIIYLMTTAVPGLIKIGRTDTLNYSVLVFPATYEETETGKYYNLDWDADPVEKMTFTNTYTKSITESTENNTNGSKTRRQNLEFAIVK